MPDDALRLAQAISGIYRTLDLFRDEVMQVNPKEQLILLTVEESAPIRVKALAAATRLPLSTVSWTADRLVRKGYLRRGSDPADRRATVLEMDRKGRRHIEKYHDVFRVIARLAEGQMGRRRFRDTVSTLVNIAQTLNDKDSE